MKIEFEAIISKCSLNKDIDARPIDSDVVIYENPLEITMLSEKININNEIVEELFTKRVKVTIKSL